MESNQPQTDGWKHVALGGNLGLGLVYDFQLFLNLKKSSSKIKLLFVIRRMTRWIKMSLPMSHSCEKSLSTRRYLSLLAGWRLSSCLRLLLPGVAAGAFTAQPPLCLLLPCSASFSHTWQHVQTQQTWEHIAGCLLYAACTAECVHKYGAFAIETWFLFSSSSSFWRICLTSSS